MIRIHPILVPPRSSLSRGCGHSSRDGWCHGGQPRASSNLAFGTSLAWPPVRRTARYSRQVAEQREPWDVGGPVLAEVVVVRLHGGIVELTGPCGAGPWLIESGPHEHPMGVVERVVRDVVGEPLVIHSTSWRRVSDSVVLTFVAVIDETRVGAMATRPVRRGSLARGDATTPPGRIEFAQVVEHALRHLAWLVADDESVRSALGPQWRRALEAYVPAPFRALP